MPKWTEILISGASLKQEPTENFIFIWFVFGKYNLIQCVFVSFVDAKENSLKLNILQLQKLAPPLFSIVLSIHSLWIAMLLLTLGRPSYNMNRFSNYTKCTWHVGSLLLESVPKEKKNDIRYVGSTADLVLVFLVLLVPTGTHCTGTHWYPLVPTVTHWYPLVPTGTRWYPMVPSSTH